MNITTVGVDLAKDLITIYAADSAGRMISVRDLRCREFAAWLVQLPPGCMLGMEACSSAHHWARRMLGLGLVPRLMAADFVQPFRKSRATKNDHNDAEAICTAVRQPNMRFVAVKSVEQQTRLAWHRVREGFKEERTAVINRTRGLLAEFGIVIGKSSSAFNRALAGLVRDETQPESLRSLLERMRLSLVMLDEQMATCDRQIAQQVQASEAAKRIQAIPGVGPLTADAIVSTVGDAREFKNGRQFAAWQGLTPRQYSSGGKTRLGRITRRGDAYLRTLLIQGARSTLQAAMKRMPDKRTRIQQWMIGLAARVGYHKTLVAIANKHARMIWSILAKGEEFNIDAWQQYQAGV